MKKLGFGLMRLPVLDIEDDSTINYDKVNRMVDYFIDNGFTYFDTAYFYHNGKSQVAVKKALSSRYNRSKYILADKMPISMINKKEQYEKIFNEQLEACGVDYFDYYLLHALNNTTYEKSIELGGFNFIKKMKEQGKAKKIGFSFHDTPEVLDKVLTNHPEVEFVQLQINYLDWEDESVQSKKCYDIARKHGKDIIVMGPVKGGLLSKLTKDIERTYKDKNPNLSIPSWGIRYAASLDGVFMVLSGMSTMEQLKDNISFMTDFKEMDSDEKNIISKTVKSINDDILIACTDCKYCIEDCPQNIPIPKYFEIYNKSSSFLNMDILKSNYQFQTANNAKASECIACGNCEEVCPQHLKIINLLEDVVNLLEK